jgi:hypothetical protein
MAMQIGLQYIMDGQGRPIGVIVPIDRWREILSELETSHLLQSEAMRGRLVAALARPEGILLEVVREKLGV